MKKLKKIRVAVLMATFNGIDWLPYQILSILNQSKIDITLFISDDFSTDNTFQYIQSIRKEDKRIIILPRRYKFGSAAKNFYRLINDVNFSNFDYVSFSDQDDIWMKNKLIRHIGLINKKKVECVSSNVIAFWEDGTRKLIDKSQEQKKWDFIFESAGPGCSFLMTNFLASQVQFELKLRNDFAKNIKSHDWLVYAICRAKKFGWFIDSKPSLFYRQHKNNVLGANSGFKAIFLRLCRIISGEYKNEVLKVCRFCLDIERNKELSKLNALLKSSKILSRMQLINFIPMARRKFKDRVILGILIATFLF